MDKKKLYQKPVFVPIILTIIALLAATIYIFVQGGTVRCAFGVGACNYGIANTIINVIPLILLAIGAIWIVFGIIYAIWQNQNQKDMKNTSGELLKYNIQIDCNPEEKSKILNFIQKSKRTAKVVVPFFIVELICFIRYGIGILESSKPGALYMDFVGAFMFIVASIFVLIVNIPAAISEGKLMKKYKNLSEEHKKKFRKNYTFNMVLFWVALSPFIIAAIMGLLSILVYHF